MAAAFPFFKSAAASEAARATALERWRERIQGMLDRGRLPIVDLQATYVDPSVKAARSTTNIVRIKAWMDEADVAQIAFAAAFAPDSGPSLALWQADPAYFIPFTNSGEFPRWWEQPESFVAGLARDLATGRYFGMGEHEFRHYPSPEQAAAGMSARDITVPIDGPAGQALFKLSADTGMSFQIHYEVEDALLTPLEAMLDRHPGAHVVWCHLGQVRYPDRSRRYGPAYVQGLIERHAGLMFDLAVAGPKHVYGPSGVRDSTLYDAQGRVGAGWQSVIERHPDRFMVASDYRPAVEANFPQVIRRHRETILAAFGPATQHALAYGNAWRLLSGRAWAP